MIYSKNGSITVITQEKAKITEFVKKVEDKYDEIKNDNVIIDLFSLKTISVNDISEFIRVSTNHKANRRSFVIVTNMISYDDIPESITLVPTLKEAHDLIEMEEIERDLEF